MPRILLALATATVLAVLYLGGQPTRQIASKCVTLHSDPDILASLVGGECWVGRDHDCELPVDAPRCAYASGGGNELCDEITPSNWVCSNTNGLRLNGIKWTEAVAQTYPGTFGHQVRVPLGTVWCYYEVSCGCTAVYEFPPNSGLNISSCVDGASTGQRFDYHDQFTADQSSPPCMISE